MTTPKISIVMPTYNGSKYLRQSIESCLNQTYQNIELIIIDDCSKDDTPQIIKSYSDPRIRYYRNETNQRLPRSLNIGFKYAQGDYLSWTSDDNYYAPTAIEEMYTYLKTHHADFVYCDFEYIYVTEQGRKKIRELQDADKSLKYEDCIGACFMYSRKVYETVGDYDHDMEFVEDYDYWVRVSLQFQMGHIKKPLYHYRYHDLSISGTKYAEIQIMEYLLKLKYNLLDREQVNWFLRGLSVKYVHGPMFIKKVKNRIFLKDKISSILDEFIQKKTSCSPTRYRLSELLYNKKHYVFLRKFDPNWEWGGAEQLIMDVLERINYDLCKITLVVSQGSKAIFEKRRTEASKRVLIVEMPFSLRANAWQRFWRMFGLFKDFKPYQIVFMQGWYADFRAAEFFAAWLTSWGKVYTHENSAPPEPLEKTSRTYGGNLKGIGLWWHMQRFYVVVKTIFCRKILTVSKDVGEELVRLWQYPKDKIKTVTHGVNSGTYFPSLEMRHKVRSARHISESSTIVVTHARLSAEKRIDRIIEAFAKAADKRDGFFLWIAGEGALKSDLEDQVRQKNIGHKVHFLGRVGEIPDLLRACDFYVCGSDTEGLGIALLEAMATGLVCISTRCSGPKEIISDGKDGFLVEKDVDSMAQVMTKCFHFSAEQRHEIGQAARQRVTEHFDLYRNTKLLLETLKIPAK